MFKLAKSLSLAKVIAILFAVSPFLALGFISDSDAATKFNIKVDPSLQLTVPNTSPSIMLDTPDGEIHQTTLSTTITTNNPTGYTLMLLMNGSDLINRANPDYTIPTVEESVNTDDFTINRWGILGRGDNLYHPAASGYLINTTDTPITNAEENVTFGVKVDAELPSGAYDCDLTIVAIANRIPYTIDTIDYMQEIDEDVIDSMVVGTQYQLEDKRDDKKYYVAKLRDGNVWMTQNLDFTLSAEGTELNPDTSDVATTKTVTVSTNTETWGQDATLAYYKDAGNLYRPNGLDAVADSSALALDSNDQHYQLGSYYSWNAATAGSGANTETGAVASESICPSGWKLPTASETIGDASADLNGLYAQYFGGVFERYSHTPNVRDDGTQNGNYSNNMNTPGEVITIPGAVRLHIKLKYGGESVAYDWVSFWVGSHTDYTAGNNSSTGVRFGNNSNGRYGGSNGTTVEGDIEGDTVTFSFRSDGGGVGNGFGYYAIITGYYADGTPILGTKNIKTNGIAGSDLTGFFQFKTNLAGKFDSANDWTSVLRSMGYWSSINAGNGQAFALDSQEVEDEVEPGEEQTTSFEAHPNSVVDTTKGLNVRCIAKPASF